MIGLKDNQSSHKAPESHDVTCVSKRACWHSRGVVITQNSLESRSWSRFWRRFKFWLGALILMRPISPEYTAAMTRLIFNFPIDKHCGYHYSLNHLSALIFFLLFLPLFDVHSFSVQFFSFVLFYLFIVYFHSFYFFFLLFFLSFFLSFFLFSFFLSFLSFFFILT